MSLKIPPGSKSIEIEWLSEQIIIITSITQLRKIKKWNDTPDEVLCDDDWYLYSGKRIDIRSIKNKKENKMKETIKKLQKKIDELVDKVPNDNYVNVNSIKSLADAILSLAHAESFSKKD